MSAKFLTWGSLWALTLATAWFAGARSSDSPGSGDARDRPPSHLSDRRAPEATVRSPAAERRVLSPGLRLASNLPPVQAVAELAQLSDPLERSRGFLALVDRLSPEEFLAVVAEFRDLGITRERMGEYRLLLSAWARVDPLTALQYAREHTEGDFARNTVLATWARNDLEGAVAWAEANHKGEGANPWMVGIISGIATTDPARASELMESLPYSRERGRALNAVVGAMMNEDPVKARSWAESVNDDRLRSGAIAYVAEELARKEPEQAAQWLASVDDLAAQQRAAEDVAERFAEEDVDKAKAWAESLKPEAVGDAVEGVVDRLVEKDPIQAAEWLASLGQNNTTNLDGAIGELIRGAARKDPYLAATWISGLTEQRDRERYYHRIIGPWMEQDAAAARDFLDTNEVPESIRRRFDGK